MDLVAASAVGAALISGGPLVAVGHVHGMAHALLAGAGLVLALTGVGLAIWSTSTVLSPRLTTPADAEVTRAGRAAGSDRGRSRAVLRPGGDEALTRCSSIRRSPSTLARLLAAEKEPAKRKMIKRQLTGRRRTRASGPLCPVAAGPGPCLADRAGPGRSRWFALAGGVLVIAGSVLFFTATGGPTYVPVLTPQVTAVPSATAPSPAIPGRSPVPSVTP